MTDLAAKHALLLAGVGWGYMPVHSVQADLEAGKLVHLRLPGIPEEDAQPVFVLWHAKRPPGPCAQWLIDALRASRQEAVREQPALQAQQMQQQ